MNSDLMNSKNISKAEDAHTRRVKILTALNNGNKSYLIAGHVLSEAVKEKDYKILGYERAEDYFYHEFQLKRSTAYNLIAVAEKFLDVIVSNKLDIPHYTRLVKLLSCATSENTEELIHKAISLSPEDFENCIRELQGKITTDNCSHPEWQIISVCKVCRKKEVKEKS